MHSFRKICYLIIISICMSAILSCRYRLELFESKANTDIPNEKLSTTKDYRINPQDVLQVRNLQDGITEHLTKMETMFSQEGNTYLVEHDSTVALPMLGRVKVAGLTRTEAARQLEGLYRKELKDPIIELKIINLKVTLLGEIKNQGVYSLTRDHTSLVEIIGLAGGLTDKANGKNIKIIRGNLQKPQIFELDLTKLKTLSDSRLMLQNNDIIYIARHKRAVQLQQLQNVPAFLQPVIALLNTALIISTIAR